MGTALNRFYETINSILSLVTIFPLLRFFNSRKKEPTSKHKK